MADSKRQKSFVLYLDNYDFIEDLPINEKGNLFDAIFHYKCDGELPDFEKGTLLSGAFRMIKNQLDRDAAKWEAECKQRAESGRQGGLAKARNAKERLAPLSTAKQEQAEVSEGKHSLANLADNDNDTVNDNDTENVIDTDSDIENGIETQGAEGTQGQKPLDGVLHYTRNLQTIRKTISEIINSGMVELPQDFTKEDISRIFSYYFEEYRNTILDFERNTRVVERSYVSYLDLVIWIKKMPSCPMPDGSEQILEPGDYSEIIRRYFKTKFEDGCDYHLRHFFSGEIRGYKYLEMMNDRKNDDPLIENE